MSSAIPLGKRVKVVSRSDQEMPKGYIGLTGVIVEHLLECGGTADDPMYVVHFRDTPREGFWFEELELVKVAP